MMRHNNARGRGGGGSMMSPDIQELELELQLLKRKRQLLQQQQEMLIGGQHSNRERQRDYNYDQSSQMYNQQQGSQDFNFSHLYKDRVTGSGDRGRQFGQKRPSTDPWHSDTPAKRFFGSRGRSRNAPASRSSQGYGSNRGESKFGQRSNADQRPPPPRNVDARPSFGNNNERSGPTYSRGPRNRPNRVNKPRAVSPPNKLSSYPRSERRKLVDEASKSIDDDSIILTADKPPNPTMSGRMELALGNILKELRQDFEGNEKYSEIFSNDRLVKVVKQTLRERIRDVMIGQRVTGMKFIITSYREKYTKETDQEIIDNAMEVADATRRENKLAIRLVESETPENYFRFNMGKLLDVKLDEMFKKLESLYKDENCEKLQDIIDAQIPNLSTVNEEESGKEKYDPEVALESSDAANDETANDCVVIDANENNSSVNDTTINETTDNANPSTDDDKDITLNDTNRNEIEENKTENLNETNQNEEMSESDAKFVKAWKLCNQKYFNQEFYEKLINHNLKYKLPRILPKYKDMILNILDVDKQYRATKAAIVSRIGGKIDKKINAESKITSRKTSDGQRLPINHFVKVVGRPGLPKRKAMSKFLEDFNPLTIKKHKAVHNLLFIGLHAKEDLDRILAATGTRIGNVTLTIAVSERNNQANKSTEKNDSKQMEDNNAEAIKEEPSKELINEELDNQITDLLTSVGKEESEAMNEPKLETIDETAEENAENKQIKEDTEVKPVENDKVNNEHESSEKSDANAEAVAQNENADIKVEVTKTDAKETAVATPTRSSTRIAASTPNTVRTRRSSKLAQ